MNARKDQLQEATDQEVISVVSFFVTAISVLILVPVLAIILVIGLS